MNPSPTLRRLAALGAAASLVSTLLWAPSARADDTGFTPDGHGAAASRRLVVDTTADEQAPRVQTAVTEAEAAIAKINNYRTRAGLAKVALTGSPGAVTSHARYVNLNRNVPGLDVGTELKTLPGYTDAGKVVAPQTVAAVTSSFSALVDIFISDPQASGAHLLNPLTTKVAFVRSGEVEMMWFAEGDRASTPVPITFPTGAVFPRLQMDPEAAQFYTRSCPMTSTRWGFPLTFQWNWATYTGMYVNRAQLLVDGRPVAHCVMNNVDNTALNGQVVLIPQNPLPAGSYVSATVQVTATGGEGGTQVLNASNGFSTAVGTKKGFGDQTGDGIADVLAVTSGGDLLIYKGVHGGALRNGWQVGHGWGAFIWMSRVPDVTGDGRDDLVGVRSDGHMYLYTGSGMGAFHSGRKVGQNWQGMRNLTVVADMTGNGRPEVVGISAKNELLRYTLTPRGFASGVRLGQRWGGIVHMASVGSLNGDARPDLIAITARGDLYQYTVSSTGTISGTQRVGGGWGGWTALYSPGDFTGDGRRDLLGRTPDGSIYAYRNTGTGLSLIGRVGTGWNGMRLLG